MSKKFNQGRSVSENYAKVPMYYTGINRPGKPNHELVIMDQIGGNYSACWRSNDLDKVGIEFLLPVTENGFLFKDKEVKLATCSRVW